MNRETKRTTKRNSQARLRLRSRPRRTNPNRAALYRVVMGRSGFGLSAEERLEPGDFVDLYIFVDDGVVQVGQATVCGTPGPQSTVVRTIHGTRLSRNDEADLIVITGFRHVPQRGIAPRETPFPFKYRPEEQCPKMMDDLLHGRYYAWDSRLMGKDSDREKEVQAPIYPPEEDKNETTQPKEEVVLPDIEEPQPSETKTTTDASETKTTSDASENKNTGGASENKQSKETGDGTGTSTPASEVMPVFDDQDTIGRPVVRKEYGLQDYDNRLVRVPIDAMIPVEEDERIRPVTNEH